MLEEGVATHRDIDFGMMAGAGLDPRRGLMPPFMKADIEGLDTILERMENAAGAPRRALRAADDPAPPGRPGAARPEERPGLLRLPAARRRAARRGRSSSRPASDGVAIAWLANGQMNSISPQVVEDLAKVWAQVKDSGVRALVIASSNPFLFSAGADIKAFTTMDEAAGAQLHRRHARAAARARQRRASPRSPPSTASPSAAAASSRWPATCASPRARRCSASPRSSSGSSPASAAPSACRGWSATNKALEMNLVGDPILAEEAFELGLVNRVVEDHELLDTALVWARKLAGAGAARARADQARLGAGDLDEGIEAEKQGFADGLRQRGRQGGHLRLPRQTRAAASRGAERRGRRRRRRGAGASIARAGRADRAAPARSSR